MPRRFWVKNEVRRRNPDGSTSIYCQKCGREIIRQNHPSILSVTKCMLCVLKEQGVPNAEDYVLTQYRIQGEGIPVPMDLDDAMMGGVLLLNPEGEKPDINNPIPPVNGIMGTVRSVFRTLGFQLPKPLEPGKSQQLATEKRSGLFGPQKGRR